MKKEWQPIEDAPKDGTIIDLLIEGSRYDVEFYGASPSKNGDVYRGRCTDVWFKDGAFRPMQGLVRLHSVSMTVKIIGWRHRPGTDL